MMVDEVSIPPTQGTDADISMNKAARMVRELGTSAYALFMK